MIEFILNNQKVKTERAKGISLLDFIRKDNRLTGTKIGCREGDCGACTVLEGSLNETTISYKTIVSCLTPLVNAHGKHIVTVEGFNLVDLSPVQKAIVGNSGTQCGFCTPGFVVSLSGFLLSNENADPIQALSGNICRCTGYKSIEKAALELDKLKALLPEKGRIEAMIEKEWLPEYFRDIPKNLKEIKALKASSGKEKLIGGGTDLMVQQAETIRENEVISTTSTISNSVKVEGDKIIVGAGITINDFFNHSVIKSLIPDSENIFPLIASEQIRNMGTIAGNIVNASPIGGLSILFLALNAKLNLRDFEGNTRSLNLNKFFIDYKKTALKENEVIDFIVFEKPKGEYYFNFEKVSKRTYLDIASVNSALNITLKNDCITNATLSVGGLAPCPKILTNTSAYLHGKPISTKTLQAALDIIQDEISPISDIRGSKEYKRLLIRQLFIAHFTNLFSSHFKPAEIRDLVLTNTISYEKY